MELTKEETGIDKISIIMLGDAGVGKSCISVTFKSGQGAAQKVDTTIGIDLWTKVVAIDDKKLKAVIYDTSGQERYRSIPKSYIRKGDGIALVYDITSRKSFDSLACEKDSWLNEVESLRDDKPPLIVMGNKSDLGEAREVTEKEGIEFAESIGAFFTETTVMDSKVIDSAFQILIKTVYIKKNADGLQQGSSFRSRANSTKLHSKRAAKQKKTASSCSSCACSCKPEKEPKFEI
ncbi:unnamed protein product [Moneuplotes crassus]|uniref:Uncharacterized protein n=1 Tax=Euplotes crassus TaxID=5936 RepID=A0AAD1XBC5_EUPCR|nr:unnamed protein product [Moneuplotes crassus]